VNNRRKGERNARRVSLLQRAPPPPPPPSRPVHSWMKKSPQQQQQQQQQQQPRAADSTASVEKKKEPAPAVREARCVGSFPSLLRELLTQDDGWSVLPCVLGRLR
jgi:hypothetical protein